MRTTCPEGQQVRDATRDLDRDEDTCRVTHAHVDVTRGRGSEDGDEATLIFWP